jgi:hypothetical protein
MTTDPSGVHRGNFGIKLLSSQNWGHVFTPKFGKKNAGTQSFQDYVIKESIA